MEPEQPSHLTAEEEEMLKPKELKVVNPWIHEATHKEYLEQVKVRALTDSIGSSSQTCQRH